MDLTAKFRLTSFTPSAEDLAKLREILSLVERYRLFRDRQSQKQKKTEKSLFKSKFIARAFKFPSVGCVQIGEKSVGIPVGLYFCYQRFGAIGKKSTVQHFPAYNKDVVPGKFNYGFGKFGKGMYVDCTVELRIGRKHYVHSVFKRFSARKGKQGFSARNYGFARSGLPEKTHILGNGKQQIVVPAYAPVLVDGGDTNHTATSILWLKGEYW